MHRVVSILTLAVVAVAAPGQDDQPLKSGPQAGANLPSAFDAFNLNGKTAPNRFHCLVCEHGLNPVVAVFTRESAGEALDVLSAGLDEAVTKHEKRYLGAFVVYLSPAARSSVADQTGGEVEKILEEAKARDALIASLKPKADALKNVVVAIYPEEGPKDYNIHPKAETTVIFYDRLKVKANWAFEKDKMKKEDAEAILKRVEELLFQTKKKPAG